MRASGSPRVYDAVKQVAALGDAVLLPIALHEFSKLGLLHRKPWRLESGPGTLSTDRFLLLTQGDTCG